MIMRILPELEFLNGLPVDREALNESMQSNDRNTQAAKHTHEVEDVIQEEEAEATIDEQQPIDIEEDADRQESVLHEENSLSILHSSHLSGAEADTQQQLIGQHLDTSELEAIAICYDNIRQMRRRIPNNNDFELG